MERFILACIFFFAGLAFADHANKSNQIGRFTKVSGSSAVLDSVTGMVCRPYRPKSNTEDVQHIGARSDEIESGTGAPAPPAGFKLDTPEETPAAKPTEVPPKPTAEPPLIPVCEDLAK